MRHLAFALLAVVVLSSPCFAQNYGGRFGSFGGGRSFGMRTRARYQSPSRPTLSPYLNYFRADNGALNPFYNFIQPGRQLQSQNQSINQRFDNQQRQIGGLQTFQNGLQNQQVRGRGTGRFGFRSTGASQTGKGATFMNYSHFFQIRGGNRGGGGRRR